MLTDTTQEKKLFFQTNKPHTLTHVLDGWECVK